MPETPGGFKLIIDKDLSRAPREMNKERFLKLLPDNVTGFKTDENNVFVVEDIETHKETLWIWEFIHGLYTRRTVSEKTKT